MSLVSSERHPHSSAGHSWQIRTRPSLNHQTDPTHNRSFRASVLGLGTVQRGESPRRSGRTDGSSSRSVSGLGGGSLRRSLDRRSRSLLSRWLKTSGACWCLGEEPIPDGIGLKRATPSGHGTLPWRSNRGPSARTHLGNCFKTSRVRFWPRLL